MVLSDQVLSIVFPPTENVINCRTSRTTDDSQLFTQEKVYQLLKQRLESVTFWNNSTISLLQQNYFLGLFQMDFEFDFSWTTNSYRFRQSWSELRYTKSCRSSLVVVIWSLTISTYLLLSSAISQERLQCYWGAQTSWFTMGSRVKKDIAMKCTAHLQMT